MQKLFVKIYTCLNEINENVIESALHLKQLAEEAESKLIEQHLALVEACLHAVARQLQSIEEATDASELAERQVVLATKWRDEVLAFGQTIACDPEEAVT